MLEELEKHLRESKKTGHGRFALLNNRQHELCEITTGNWKALGDAQENCMAFVDGGSAALINTPTAELHKLRTAAVLVAAGKIVKVRRKEGYVLIIAEVTGGKTKRTAKTIQSTLDLPGRMETGEQAVDEARRLAELGAAEWAVNELAGMSVGQKFIILDGTLETFSDMETAALGRLSAAAAARNIELGSVAKTCSILTDTGQPLIEAARNTASGTGFIPVASRKSEDCTADIAVAKLHDSSSYLFRLEAAGSSRMMGLATALAAQSNDLTFPGYPYGLIMADAFARISNSDAELTKTKIRATATGEIMQMLAAEKALGAHSILDSM